MDAPASVTSQHDRHHALAEAAIGVVEDGVIGSQAHGQQLGESVSANDRSPVDRWQLRSDERHGVSASLVAAGELCRGCAELGT